MPDLIAIAYAEETIAAQAAEELERRAFDLPIDLDAVGVIVCERDGSCQLTTSCHPGATAGWSKFWGGLLGGVMGDVEVRGIDSSFRRQIKGMLKPATSILFVVVGRVRPEQAVEALSQYGGTVFRYALDSDGVAGIRDAVNGERARA